MSPCTRGKPIYPAPTSLLLPKHQPTSLLNLKGAANCCYMLGNSGQIFTATQQKGYTCVPLALYWKGNKVKCEIALAKGKQQHDKRAATKEKDWQRDKQRLMKASNRM